jgi:hypothetical protein
MFWHYCGGVLSPHWCLALLPSSFLFDEVFSFSTKKLLDQKVLAPIKGKAKGLPHQVTDHERHKLAAAATVDTPDNGQ